MSIKYSGESVTLARVISLYGYWNKLLREGPPILNNFKHAKNSVTGSRKQILCVMLKQLENLLVHTKPLHTNSLKSLLELLKRLVNHLVKFLILQSMGDF